MSIEILVMSIEILVMSIKYQVSNFEMKMNRAIKARIISHAAGLAKFNVQPIH